MALLAAAALLFLQAGASAPTADVRTIVVSVTDSKGNPVEGLSREDVAVLENGAARDLTRLEPEVRPLTVVVIVDSSEAISSSFRLNVVDAVAGFLARLPEGARYALWTTGDRPTRIVDFTDDVTAAGKALKRVIPQGGNTLLDAVVEASRELKGKEGVRTAVVAVTGTGIGFANYDRRQVVERASKNAMLFLGLQFEEGRSSAGPSGDQGEVGRADYEYVLGGLASATGGVFETTLSAMGLDAGLRKVGAELRSHYRLTYVSPAEINQRKVEVQVARPGARARVVSAQP